VQIIAFINDIICYRNMKILNNSDRKAAWKCCAAYCKYSSACQNIYCNPNNNEIFVAEEPKDSKKMLDFTTTANKKRQTVSRKTTDYWNTCNCTQNIDNDNSMLSRVQCNFNKSRHIRMYYRPSSHNILNFILIL